MIWIGYILAVLVGSIVFVLETGPVDAISLKICAIMAAALLIPFYFMSRENKAPTRVEAWLAATWIITRRVVGMLGFLLFGGVSVLFTIDLFGEGFTFDKVMMLLICLFASLIILWKGWYGEGKQEGFGDDRPSHDARKKRYKWK